MRGGLTPLGAGFDSCVRQAVIKPPTVRDCILKTQDFNRFMRTLPTGAVDLILTDPPYVISRKTGFAKIGKNSVERFALSMEFGEWDAKEINLKKFAELSYAALRNGGTIICFYDLWKFNYLASAK